MIHIKGVIAQMIRAGEKTMKQKPKLMRSGMLDILYIVTKYDDLGKGNFLAKEKFEVTEEELRLLRLKKE